MWKAIKRTVEFIKFVVGSALIAVGVLVGGIAKFVCWIANRAVESGLSMTAGLQNRCFNNCCTKHKTIDIEDVSNVVEVNVEGP